jgi:putative transposase
MQERWSLPVQRGCRAIRLNRSTYYYKPKEKDDSMIIEQLNRLADKHPTYGFWKMYHRLRNKGYKWNHKRVYRVYCNLKMNIRRKRKRRLPARVKRPLEQPEEPNQVWSMDFMSDSLWEGYSFRILNVLDDYNREALAMEIDRSLPSERVVKTLDRLKEERGAPRCIRVDNGPEFLSDTFKLWCQENGVDIQFIQPGKPMQNGYIERFNGNYRRELLDAYIFRTLGQAKQMTEEWKREYNHKRPHDSLNNKTPVGFAQMN